jgi:hypothetical protein
MYKQQMHTVQEQLGSDWMGTDALTNSTGLDRELARHWFFLLEQKVLPSLPR